MPLLTAWFDISDEAIHRFAPFSHGDRLRTQECWSARQITLPEFRVKHTNKQLIFLQVMAIKGYLNTKGGLNMQK